jgi:hypothetical protein
MAAEPTDTALSEVRDRLADDLPWMERIFTGRIFRPLGEDGEGSRRMDDHVADLRALLSSVPGTTDARNMGEGPAPEAGPAGDQRNPVRGELAGGGDLVGEEAAGDGR